MSRSDQPESEALRADDPSYREGSGTELDLAVIVARWWRARVRIVKWGLGGLVAVVLVIGSLFVLRRTQQESRLQFQLLFDGASQKRYPTGDDFSPSDIVATPVLQEVYARNALDRFFSFEDFKKAIAVTNSNAAAERLRRDYEGRLSDRRLTTADKKQIEDEYATQLASLQNGEFTLVLDLGGAFTRWPETLAGKVLGDTLAVWAEQSRDRGVLTFNLNSFSDQILSDLNPVTDDYPVLLDRIRVTINRMQENLRQLSVVPGALLVRVGENEVSVGELQLRLQDDLEYRLGTIEAAVLGAGLYRNRTLSEAYVREQLLRVQRESEEASQQVDAAMQGLNNYRDSRSGGAVSSAGGGTGGTTTSAYADSFLQQMLDLSTRQSDVSFRQSIVQGALQSNDELARLDSQRRIYEQMQSSLDNPGQYLKGRQADLEPWVQGQLKDLIAGLKSTLADARLLHDEIAQRNLQPSMAYVVPDPVQQIRSSSPGMATVLVLPFLGWAAFMGCVLLITAWPSESEGRR